MIICEYQPKRRAATRCHGKFHSQKVTTRRLLALMINNNRCNSRTKQYITARLRVFMWSQERGRCGLTRPSASAYILATGNHNIEETIEERDLGVLITETLSPSHHIASTQGQPDSCHDQVDIRGQIKEQSCSTIQKPSETSLRPHSHWVRFCSGF